MVEVKSRVNDGKTEKTRQPIGWDNHDPAEMVTSFVREHGVHEPLQPSIGNQFRRITLLGRLVDERITIDLDLQFQREVRLGIAWKPEEQFDLALKRVCVVEVKSGLRSSSQIGRDHLRRLGSRPQSFSKYCAGVILLHPEIRANRFRPMMRMLAKMEEV